MSFFAELRRRNVLRIAAAYLVTAWLLVQVVATISPAFGLGAWVVRVTVIAFAIGFIPALIFAWIFELTPQGLRRDSDADADHEFARRAARNLDRAIIVVLTLAVGYFAIDKFLIDPSRDAELQEAAVERGRAEALQQALAENSVAVLPFRNLSGDSNNEFISAGIAEDVLSALSLVPRLRVISGYSSFAVSTEGATVPEIAERLNATVLVDGSVRRVGDELRISARLIDARSDSQVWADDYDRRYENVLALQAEISEAIVSALRAKLGLDIGGAPAIATAASPAAHEAYLRGRLLVRQRTPSAIRRAVDEFGEAVSVDPDYAIAHAELAIAIALTGVGPTAEMGESSEARFRFHATRAYELDPNLAEANAARAWAVSGDERLAYLQRAVEINPNYSDAWYWLYSLGDFDQTLEEQFDALEHAVSIDPLSQPANWDHVYALIARNRVEDARARIEHFESLDRQGATFLRGLLESLGGNTSRWSFGYLEAATSGPDDLIFGNIVSWQWVWHFEHLGLINEMIVRRDEVGPDIDVYYGDMARGIGEARAMLEEDPESWFAAMKLGQFLAHAGELVEAHPLLEKGWENLGETYLSHSHDMNGAVLAESLIAARRAVGDTEGADRVVAIWRDSVRAHRAAGITATYEGWYGIDYHDGIVSWLEGNHEQALQLLRRAVDNGFTIPPPSVFQRERYADPAFAGLLVLKREIQRRERHKLLAVVCNDNPYADVWQPLDETCDDYRRELARR